MRHLILSTILAGAAGLILAHLTPASALTMKECSDKYKAAQADGTLGTMKWNDFRTAQCGTAAAAPATAPSTTGAIGPRSQARPSAAPSMPGNAVFPAAISSKYSTETAGKARMHTCLDQYKANQTAGGNGNGSLKWIEKGGGYYSQCNAHLKG